MSIYFARGDDYIKIGFSVLVKGRLLALNTASPNELELLATVPGSMAFERAIHQWLAPYRLRGEWFRDCAPVREAITAIQERGPAAIGFFEPEPEPKPTLRRARKEKDEFEDVTAVLKRVRKLLNKAQRTRDKELVRELKPLNLQLLALIDEAIVNASVYGDDEHTDTNLKIGARRILDKLKVLSRPPSKPEARP